MTHPLAVQHVGFDLDAPGGTTRIKIWTDVDPNDTLIRLMESCARSVKGAGVDGKDSLFDDDGPVLRVTSSDKQGVRVVLIVKPGCNVHQASKLWFDQYNAWIKDFSEANIAEYSQPRRGAEQAMAVNSHTGPYYGAEA